MPLRAGLRAVLGGALVAAGLVSAPGLIAPSAAATPTTITPNPWYAAEPFEGWGTSLVWFANATGDYPTELRQKLYDLLFTDGGLDLTVARYNIGGGNASDVTDYLRPGGAVDGYWKADPDGTSGLYQDGAGDDVATTVADRADVLASFDPDDDAHYDWDADSTQRWWLEQLNDDDQITHWEAFANSAPYFMTYSGYVSGGFDSSAEQLDAGAYDKYATYLKRVVEHLEDEYAMDFDTLDPFNEPNTNYWGTTLSGGVPTGGRQEGMHVGPVAQESVITALHQALTSDDTTTDAVISAMDETNPSTFASNWAAYDAASKAAVGQMNTHTYSTGSRLAVRDQSKVADKPLWMSEVEGDWSDSDGFDPADIDNGIGLADRINGDLRELEPSAWVLWQPVEDLYNMDGTYADSEDLNWGSVFIDFDCQYYDENSDGVDQTSEFKSARRVEQEGGDSTAVEPCDIRINAKFNVMRNYTNFIHPGDQIVPTDNANTTAAISSADDSTTLVYSNSTSTANTVTVDLSRFGNIAANATAITYVTTQPDSANTIMDVEASGIVAQDPVPVSGSSVTIDVPAKSVTTIVVDGVSGVADDAAAVHDDNTYQVVGTQSAMALTDATSNSAATTATTITTPATSADAVANQLWTFHTVDAGSESATKAYVITTQDGDVLTATSAGTAMSPLSIAQAKQDPTAIWILNSTDGKTYSLVNKSITQTLEVGGQSTTNGASVGVYGSNGGTNQSWTIRSITPTGSVDQVVSTPVGAEPTLPATATPVYRWGNGNPVNVSWNLPAASAWAKAGEVTVTGAATDVYGSAFAATTTVVVGSYNSTDPVSATVMSGTSISQVQAAAPTTVDARIGKSSAAFPTNVAWDWSGVTDASFASAGVVTVPGEVASNDPAADTVGAVLSVIVTEPADVDNLCTADVGVVVSATYSESSYPAANTCDGSTLTRWSNWVSGGRSSDTLTYAFTKSYQVNALTVTSFERAPLTAKVQYLVGDTWTDTSAGTVSGLSTTTPTTISFNPVVTSSVRLVLSFNNYGKVSEVQIAGAGAGPSPVSTLSALRLDGALVEGFASDATEYEAVTGTARFPTVRAVATDRNASVDVDNATTGHPVTTVTVAAPAGGQTTYQVAYTVDSVAPELTTAITPVAPDGTNGWYRTAPSLFAEATDDHDTAPTIEYRLPSGDWTTYTEDVRPPDLNGTVEFRATDAYGNVSEVDQVTLKVDTAAPTVGYTVNRRTMTLIGLDVNATTLTYTLDGGTSQSYDGPVALGEARTATFYATDAAGNTSATTTLDVTKDTPSVNLAVDRSTVAYGGEPLSATVNVAGQDLVDGTVSLLDNGEVIDTAPTGSGPIVLSTPRTLTVGTHQLTAVFAPGAEASTNGAASAPATVKVYKSPSTTSVGVNGPTSKRGPKVKVTVRASTDVPVSGKVKVEVRRGGKKVAGAITTLKKGKALIRVPRRGLKPGTYKVTVNYTGSTTVAASKRTVKVVVRH